MKKVKFLTAVEVGKNSFKKGTTRDVTDRYAKQLVANKQAEVIEGKEAKEDKEAAKRETK